jgi:hypothetical protein
VLFVVALLTGSLAACRRAEPASPEVRFTPIVGGTRLPTATPVDVAALDATAPPAAESTPENPWIPGQFVVAQGEALLYAQPDPTAQVLERYAEGAEFEILEPSGDYDRYPVAAGDVRFIRVRTADGLVGWVDIQALSPVEAPTP